MIRSLQKHQPIKLRTENFLLKFLDPIDLERALRTYSALVLDTNSESGLTIQQAADRLGLSSHTLRYYERAGLLTPVDRNSGGHRRFRPRDLDILRFLMRLRETGMPIHQVREYAQLAEGGPQTVEARFRLLVEHRESVLKQIEALKRNLAVLNFKIELYEQGWTFTTDDDPKLQELRQIMLSNSDNALHCLVSPEKEQP